MEIYLVKVTEDLIVTALLVGLVFCFAREAKGRFGLRAVAAGLGVAAIASIVMAWFKQNTSLIATGDWNRGIFIVALVMAVIALIFGILSAASGKKKASAAGNAADPDAQEGSGDAGDAKAKAQGKSAHDVFQLVTLLAVIVFMALRVFYKLPDVINYPVNFAVSSDKILSSDFMYRFAGLVFGLVIVVLACLAVFKAFKALGNRGIGLALGLVIGIITVVQTVTLGQILIARRIVKAGTDLYKVLFSVTSWMSNNTIIFTLAIIAIAAVLAVLVIMLSLRDDEPYENPAEHRKIKARWRNRRRWAICLIVMLVLSTATITALKDYVNRGPELSPSEECEVRDGNVYVSLEQVEDGHLHRFTYVTEAGVTLDNGKESAGGVGIRFIVIKKPGSNAYGIGLDACEICGETGYYERDGQVVCKLCDVVMNINTIGFKGGCNPIPVDYTIGDGYIVFSTDMLTQYEKTFK